MKTVIFVTATQGVLGESALSRGIAKSMTGPGWQFVFEQSEVDSHLGRADCAVVLLVLPTVAGLAWAQEQKNKWVLRGVPTARMAAAILFESDANALSHSMVQNALGVFTLRSRVPLSRYFMANNHGSLPVAMSDTGTQLLGRHLRSRFEAAFESDRGAAVPWDAIEKEVLSALWETWSAQTPVEQRVRHHIAEALSRHQLSEVEPSLLNLLERRLLDHLTGLGPLEPFLRDPEVNEIMINGIARVFVEKAGHMISIPPPFDHETHLKTLIERIVAPSGRRVDWAAPFCDVRLKDGSRVNIVLPPLTLDGPCVTIRRFRPGFATIDDLKKSGTVDEAHAQQLERAVHERRNIVIAGNTGAGKTTLMNVLASFIPDSERILTLEDAAELSISKPHVVRMETRPANTEGKGHISMRDLVVNALRMRPDRLLVGECRGDEVIPMLQAMNTGHDGSMTTLHANSADEVRPRLESLISMAAPAWPLDLIRGQIRSAVDVIVYMKREGARRRVVEVSDVT